METHGSKKLCKILTKVVCGRLMKIDREDSPVEIKKGIGSCNTKVKISGGGGRHPVRSIRIVMSKVRQLPPVLFVVMGEEPPYELQPCMGFI